MCRRVLYIYKYKCVCLCIWLYMSFIYIYAHTQTPEFIPILLKTSFSNICWFSLVRIFSGSSSKYFSLTSPDFSFYVNLFVSVSTSHGLSHNRECFPTITRFWMSGLDFQIYYYNNSSATKKDLCHLECAHILLSTQVRVPHTKGEDGSVNENTIHLETCHA